MSRFADTLRDSIRIFAANPKFIVPKLIISILYSITLVFTAELAVDALAEPAIGALFPLLALLAAVLAISFLDIIAGAMYPFMVADVKSGRRVSLGSAFGSVMGNAGKILPPVILVEASILAVIFIISVPLSLLIVSESDYTLVFTAIYLAIVVAVVFLFYSLYPVLAFEKVKFMDSFRRSIGISMGNRREVGKATIVSVALSSISFLLAFAIEFLPQSEGTLLFWAAFVIIRFLTAYVYAYLYVLSPVFYLAYGGKK